MAIVEDGKLEELYVERFATANRVGNIYVGRVVNVEPAIQAAFIDFGIGLNGFLHVSDLHPRYFPGEGDDTTERVGHKTPRRERPPIQHALRRGDEVIVQVLKDGVGSKGPTVTSYLSIPGRFLVMMPQMDNIGVSRKVEDDEQRRQMREILDQLDLPEGFGFILRTAGFQKTKTELKRDLSYLQRLWKDMERRLKHGGNKPRLLYSESDLLVRSLRDLLTGEIGQVIIDHETALKRASRFMKIVAPRGAAQLMHYPGRTPLFHAFGVEEQIALIHAREVPLPSGGRLVIDQTEALVAIDVNSGKSRDSRDSETNAYQTNVEAVDEICRQLRLRDMGGIVINDLIDMRRSEHRKDIESRFKERLKRDRARSTVLQISEFGILEMTRQRMRPSHESVHFADCQTCRGRGMVQKSDSVASEAVRELCMLLDVEKIQRVEMVVSPRVAGEMLSGKRQLLTRIERSYGKKVDVRVSEAVPVDRVGFYAYDDAGNDVDLTALPRPKKPKELKPWEDPDAASTDWADNSADQVNHDEPEPVEEAVEDFALHPIEIDEGNDGPADGPGTDQESTDGSGRKRRRRRGRRSKGGAPQGQSGPQTGAQQPAQPQQIAPAAAQTEDDQEPGEPG
ncbi:MAG: Rne/Rng family ribonuclease, partial [Phycisphaerales bacterium]